MSKLHTLLVKISERLQVRIVLVIKKVWVLNCTSTGDHGNDWKLGSRVCLTVESFGKINEINVGESWLSRGLSSCHSERLVAQVITPEVLFMISRQEIIT